MQILQGFDVDSVCCGYDGTRVWCLPRAHRAFVTGCNRIDLSRRSTTYEMRLGPAWCSLSLLGCHLTRILGTPGFLVLFSELSVFFVVLLLVLRGTPPSEICESRLRRLGAAPPARAH